MIRGFYRQLAPRIQRQSPWLLLAALVALHHLLVAHFTQDSPSYTLLVLLVWGGALITIEDLLPGFRARPTRYGLLIGSLLLVLLMIRINLILYHDFAIHLAGPLLGLALLLLSGPPRSWRPYLPALLILSLLPLQHLAYRFIPETPISFAGAQVGGLWLQALGFDAFVDGRLVILPDGAVSVESACNGMSMIVQSLAVAVIFLLAFPLRRVWARTLTLLAAPLIGFLMNSMRVALLAWLDTVNLPRSQQLFDSFHQGNGSLVFSALAVSLVGWMHLRLVMQELSHE